VELPSALPERVLAALVGPGDEPSSEIDMWQVVSGIATPPKALTIRK
jgi:hypothetical protein